MDMLIKIKNKIETILQYIKDFVDARSAHFGPEGKRFCNKTKLQFIRSFSKCYLEESKI